MTETDEKPEEKKPAKKGLHGWKAALAVFGCGSLAAFGIFGVLMFIATTFMNTLASGVDSEMAIWQSRINLDHLEVNSVLTRSICVATIWERCLT